jgi:hypothetical protein
MAVGKPKAFLAGAALVWSHQRVLWFVYIANFALAFVGNRGAVERTADILNHSLEADRLVNGFNIGTYMELKHNPNLPFSASRPMMLYSAILFAVFMLFATGGVLAAYYEDRRFTTGAFFQACGEHFWRFLRLMIYFAIVLIPVGFLTHLAGALYRKVNRESISPFPAIHVLEASVVVILVLAMCLRLWFDMAQVIAVADGEKNMRRALRSSAVLLRRNFGSLFWLSLRISLFGWIGFGLGLYFWMEHLSPESIRAALFLSQAMIVFWLATRLWQRASEALWYRQHLDAVYVTEPLPVPSPVESGLLEPEPV